MTSRPPDPRAPQGGSRPVLGQDVETWSELLRTAAAVTADAHRALARARRVLADTRALMTVHRQLLQSPDADDHP